MTKTMRADFLELRRQRIDGFCERNFSLGGTLERYRRTLKFDLVRVPLNVLLAMPLGLARRAGGWLRELGADHLGRKLENFPLGLRTRRQEELEARLWLELFECAPSAETERVVRAELERHCAGAASVPELLMLGVTALTGLSLFGECVWNPAELGSRLAGQHARSRAAAGFFLGSGAGELFYGLFPVAPSGGEVLLFTAAVTALGAGVALAAGLLLEPAQNRLGVQKRRLRELIAALETRLEIERRLLENSLNYEPGDSRTTHLSPLSRRAP